MELFQLLGTIAINGVEKAQEQLGNISEKASNTASKLQTFGEKVSDVGVKLSTTVTAGAVAAGGAMVAFANKTAATADNIDKMSQKIGISREAYQELDFICSQSGTSVDNLQASMKKLTNVLANAQQASEDVLQAEVALEEELESGKITLDEYNKKYDELYESAYNSCGGLEQLGLSLNEISEMSPEEALFATIEALQAMPDDAKRAALAQDLLGKSAQELAPLLNSGVGSMDEMKQMAHDLGLVMSDDSVDAGVKYTDTMDQLKRAFTAAATKAGTEILPKITELAQIIIEKGVPAFSKFIDKIFSVVDWFNNLDKGTQKIIAITSGLVVALGPVLVVIGKVISAVGTIISVGGKIAALVAGFNPVVLAIVAGIGAVVGAILYLWNTSEEFRNGVYELLSYLKGIFDSFVADLLVLWEENLKPCFEAIGNFLKEKVMPIFEAVFKDFILPLVKDTFDGIARFWNNSLKPILTGIINFLTGVFSGNWEKAFSGLISIAKGLLNGLVQIFMAPFDRAKNIVNRAIETIKGYFKFEWSLPKLKLPHPTISGSFSLNPPSVPTFGIEWYKKAMDDPMIMNSPTAFGINSLGQIMAGGEAGSEVVSGTDTLMEMISSAVSAQNQRTEEFLSKILQLLVQYMPQLTNMQLVMDSGVLVGELAPGMDYELGKIAARNERL